jgi:ABC-2 type transport system permease protein
MSAANAVLLLLLFNLSFLAVLFAFVAYMAKSKPVAFAVLKRNFLGYFSSPTGYVFLCLFVLLTSMAAFWPHEFFSSNMGTLSQLNYWFPIIMMFFIPAITMSIWADERRQGRVALNPACR